MTRSDVLRMIARDCEEDTRMREGQAFTGQNVAAALGEICAQIAAIAEILAQHIEGQS